VSQGFEQRAKGRSNVVLVLYHHHAAPYRGNFRNAPFGSSSWILWHHPF
jgi:hypothetical protein